VMAKIDEILAWEQRKEASGDTRFVDWVGIFAKFGRTVLATGGFEVV